MVTALVKDSDLVGIVGKYPLDHCGCVIDEIKADPKLAPLAALSQSDLDNALTSPTLRTYAKARVTSIRYTCIANAIQQELARRGEG